MDKKSIYGVILAGGRGERFWPLSRASRPKQFLRLTSEKMMLEETIDRVLPLISMDNIRIVTGESMKQLAVQAIDSIADKHILAEPVGRNTCAAIGLAAAHLVRENPDAVMVTLSADHLIRPPEKLLEILETGVEIASRDEKLITIGIVPTRPETAYGYIKLGEEYKHSRKDAVYYVSAFTEKPKAAVAHEYYYSQKYFWNSGMFIWSAKAIIAAIDQCRPDMGKALKEYSGSIGTSSEVQARNRFYEEVESVSIDVAVLESAANVLTIKADIVWDDIGSWIALSRYKGHDAENNVTVGKALAKDSFETTVYNETDGIVACLGVSDLIIVQTDNITFVVHKTRANDIKEVLDELEKDESLREYL